MATAYSAAHETDVDNRQLGDMLLWKGLLSQDDLNRALNIQALAGGSVGSILIRLGLLRQQHVYQALADLWDCTFVDLRRKRIRRSLARRFDSTELINRCFIPLKRKGASVDVVTAYRPTDELTEKICRTLNVERVNYFVATEADILRAINRVFRDRLLKRAVLRLYYRNPHESAYTIMTPQQFVVFIALLMAGLLLFVAAPVRTLITVSLTLNIGFFLSVLFKFAMTMTGARFERMEPVTDAEVAQLRDDELPTYTILLPVYREANIVGLLTQNLRSIDYPASKIQVLLLLEEDDQETIQAAYEADPPEWITFVFVPHGLPKSKPKACNVGLLFAKGEYLVIYDAEDRPEPDQLKKAVAAFRKGPANLICVQAALNYFNARENLLTRLFTLEYSYWFDYMLAGLDYFRFPIPLGGTSNHFRTDILRQLGGWDPFNMTEDADLGMRAAANGYVVGVLNSTTYEEANTRVGNWIRQRSRWIKGYMQTVLVYSRNPRQLIQFAGWRNFFGFVMLIAGTPLTFLCVLPLWLLYGVWLLTRNAALDALFPPIILYMGLFNFLLGNGLMIYLNMLAIFKRRYYDLLLFSLLNPFYWLLHSIAAYKALWQLFTRPFFWEKTDHGLSRQLAYRAIRQHRTR
ncbi:MAG: glycosyltransferase [Anaerolineae bacterium]|nr:glycosyltransferase [Anaerolineae bacterium]